MNEGLADLLSQKQFVVLLIYQDKWINRHCAQTTSGAYSSVVRCIGK